MDASPARLIDRYALVIENTIADAIDFMDALSAIVPMKIDLDLQITLMASALVLRVGECLEAARARTINSYALAPPSKETASPSGLDAALLFSPTTRGADSLAR